jgi:hypothetical protein
MAIGDTINAGLMRVDFSPIARAGQAQARANQAFGNAIGNVLDKFYEKKREKAQQESIADTLVSTFGVNREEANHLSKNKEFIPTFFAQQKAQKDYQLQLDKFNLEQEKYKQALERQKDADLQKEQEQISENQFFQKLPSLVTDPQAQRQADIAMPGLAALGNGDARNRFMQAQLQDPRNQKRVLDLNDQDFLDQFKGDPRQTERALAFLEKRREAELASQPNLGDSFASQIGSISPYYFSESDARNAVTNEATKLGINLDKDQLAQAVSKQKIISTKDLRSTADTRFSKLNLDEPRTILEAADDLEAFLNEGGVLSGKVAKEKLARMVQPAGILTEDDLRRMGTSSAFMDSLNTLLEEKKTGKIDKTLEGYLRDTTKVFRKRAQQVLQEKTDYVVNSLANNFGITPEEVRNYTQFGNIMYGLNNDQPPTKPQNTSPQITAPQSVNLNSGGIFTPVQ